MTRDLGTRARVILERELKPVYLEVQDQSARHAGHAAAGGGGHLAVIVVSPRFEGLTRLERHRLVYEILGRELGDGLHALGLRAYTAQEPRGA